MNWEKNYVMQSSNKKAVHNKCLDIMADYSLTQMVHESTRESNILDLFLTNKPGLVKNVHVIPGLGDHECVVMNSCLFPLYSKKAPRKIPLYSKANWDALKSDLSTFSSEYFEKFSNCDIDTKWSHFKEKLNSIIDDHVPTKKLSSRYHVPWINQSLKRLSRKKHRLYNKATKAKKTSKG